jgi:hypothetical protein
MHLSTSFLLLALLNSVRGATVLASAAKPPQFITLDIVNGPVAPDGFTRSTSDVFGHGLCAEVRSSWCSG